MRILLALLALHQIKCSIDGDGIKSRDVETILCRSCGRGLADPSYLHTSHLSPEYLARYIIELNIFEDKFHKLKYFFISHGLKRQQKGC